MIWFFQVMEKTYGSHGAYWEQNHPFDSQRITDLLEHLFANNPDTFAKFKDTKASDEQTYW